MSSHLDSGSNPARTRTLARMIAQLPPLLVLVVLGGALGTLDAHDARGESYGYFSVTPDHRRCISPICGGFHLQALNQPSTSCADGSQQASCYVASADFGALETPPSFVPGGVVVRGLITADEYPGFGNLGKLVAESAWTGVVPQTVSGSFFRIRNLGIVCVTHPCFSIEARVLNQSAILTLSNLDLGALGATPAQLAAAQAAAQRGDLLVTGTTAPDPGPAGEGLALIASQFWLPEPARPRCLSDAECSTGARCNAAEVCLPLPGCEPGDPCPSVCSGYCENAACTSNAECDPSQYCASDAVCRSDGACRLEVDCNVPGNDYPHIECVGHGICEASGANACGWACTNPICMDLVGYDFGACAAVLGWGVVDGACVVVSGCDLDPFALFASSGECTAACLPAQAVPALGLPGTLGLGLVLSGLAVAWSRRGTETASRRGD